MTLTGLQRFQIAKAWLKRGAEGDLEAFIEAVCKQKGITYKPVKAEDGTLTRTRRSKT